ncbi:MFS transporter [Paenibacillus radicis (ex Xue et al. 2023)]|uniref:Tetracycline resistance protein n=1 Tax=Paenibacillus radicis (ex Xue et al. 2023) TaxID=2972489 RepID=A0ABT1YAY6_9BACL|nr:MFS transporter [Paenibacillus radicis (ex Xue et al. 2023)]MCR8630351.1 MFS transporter [Paenibacillus radicis (ex Xue et al. 2023)]
MEKDFNELNSAQTADEEVKESIITHGNLKSAFAWLSFLAFFSVLNETVFNVSLPDIANQFKIPPSTANWVNTGFIIFFAIGTLIFSKISDTYGVKRLLVTGLLIYSGGSFFGFLAQFSFPSVIVARIIQGIGASAVPGLIMVIVAKYIGSKDRGKAFGLIGSMVALGEGIGPVIGGIIADYIHWSFLFLLPMMTLVSIPFFLKVLPNEITPKGKLDVVGVKSQLSTGIMTFTLPSLFLNRKFMAGVLAGCVLLGTVAGFVSMIPYLMRDVHQLTASMIGGGIIFPGTISVVLFGIVGGTLVDKRGINLVWYLGIILIVTSFLVIALFLDTTPWLMSAALILTFGGLSFVKTVISTTVAEALESNEAGAGMGMLNFACFMAEGVGIAMVGGLLSQRLLDFPLLPTVTLSTAFLFSNMILLLIVFIIIGGVIYTMAYRRS